MGVRWVRVRRCWHVAGAAAVLLASSVLAQGVPLLDAPPSPKARKAAEPRAETGSKEDIAEKAAKLSGDALRAFEKNDVAAAEAALRAQLELQPDNFVALYNLACCRALRGDKTGGLDFLERAIKAGFCDLRTLQKDGMLSSLHGEARYKDTIEHWGGVLEARRDANLEGAAKVFTRGYTNSTDEKLKLAYRSAFDEKSAAAAKAELHTLGEWGDREVFGDLLNAEKSKNDAWVVVVLPTRPDFMKWVVSLYGPGVVGQTSTIGGSYEHDSKRLVSMDLGSSLRHEFFHVLHWRDMTRRGQFHPIWIMEGLCSLVEDYDGDGAGGLRPSTSWRSNVVKRLEKLNKMDTIGQLAKLGPMAFSGSRPLAHYAEARTVFLYLYQCGKLKAWYGAYVEGYRAEPSGIAAMEKVLGKPIKDIEKDYKAWVRLLPEVPEQIASGAASLGLDVDAGNGEGPVVAAVDRRRGAPALKVGDVITSIDHRATRDIAEMVRVLGGLRVGQKVEVAYRRGKVYGEVEVELVGR